MRDIPPHPSRCPPPKLKILDGTLYNTLHVPESMCVFHIQEFKQKQIEVSYPHSKLITLLDDYILDIPVSVCVLFHMQDEVNYHQTVVPLYCTM